MPGVMPVAATDAKPRPSEHDPPVPPEHPELTLSIVPGSDPIAGLLRFPDGSTSSFSGFVELAARLERVRDPGPSPTHPPRTPAGAEGES